ncbi:MAG: RNA 2',3'-cyclic phosphodiesterase [Desulfurococcaceae archaeon]
MVSRELNEHVRTFVAVEIKNQAVLRKLIEVRNQLVATGAELKPVEDENIHLTLRFIGEIPLSLVRVLCSEISGIKYPRFQVHVKGLGAFPSPTRPRVLWAGVEEGGEKLVELHNLVENTVRRIGIPPDREEFVPHITLARVKGLRGLDKLVKTVMILQNTDFGYTEIDEVVVKKSVLTPSGPIYSNLCTVKLE